MELTPKYSFLRGVGKSLINAVIFGFPILLQVLPHEWMNLTVGGILYIVYNFLKVKATQAGMINQ